MAAWWPRQQPGRSARGGGWEWPQHRRRGWWLRVASQWVADPLSYVVGRFTASGERRWTSTLGLVARHSVLWKFLYVKSPRMMSITSYSSWYAKQILNLTPGLFPVSSSGRQMHWFRLKLKTTNHYSLIPIFNSLQMSYFRGQALGLIDYSY
jgi:hypothetical protein